jgi:hypothetical protein
MDIDDTPIGLCIETKRVLLSLYDITELRAWAVFDVACVS